MVRLWTILFLINIAWYLMRFLGGLMVHYIEPLTEKTDTDLDDHMLPIMKKLINFVIIAIVAIMVIDKLGYNVSSLPCRIGLGWLGLCSCCSGFGQQSLWRYCYLDG
jgi:MscS family membrane protein